MAYTTINKPSDYFNTVLYTGNSSTQSITGVGFQPDLIWNKSRNVAYKHYTFNPLVGTGKFLEITSNAEGTNADTVTSFDSDGFSLGSAAGNNETGSNMVSWNWLAGNGTSSNTNGSITSTVSVSTTSGFSIVKYTGNGTSGATIGHGLGSAPSFITVKRSDTPADWWSYHKSLLATYYIKLNTYDPAGAGSTIWNDTTPTSSVFTLGNNAGVNASGGTYYAYCWSEVKGFSKFGSYVGNGIGGATPANGAFVYTGFKPAFVLFKQAVVGTSAGQQWYICDDKRNTYNPENEFLTPDSAAIETPESNGMDFLSNGFKVRTNYPYMNDGSGTFIYMAFAEHPLVSSTGTPVTAR